MHVHFNGEDTSGPTTSSLKSLSAIYRKSRNTDNPKTDRGRTTLSPLVPTFAAVGEGNVWFKKSILSLDGGGGTGRSQLLILKALMQRIAKIESEEPSQPPLEVLPCQYFDYIGGTSTGGLLAILLGRLRLSVDVCLKWIDEVEGQSVAGTRRNGDVRLTQMNLLQGLATGKSLDLLRQMADGRLKNLIHQGFVEDEGMCRTIAMCVQKKKGASTPYMFRSYKAKDRAIPGLNDRNPTIVNDLSVADTISAISAQKAFQHPVKSEESFMDGSLEVNNPTDEIQREVSKTHGHDDDCIDYVLSIGSGGIPNPKKSSGWPLLQSQKKRNLRLMCQRTEQVHRTMEKFSYGDDAFEYFRLGLQTDPALLDSNMSGKSSNSRVQVDGIKLSKGSEIVTYLETSQAQFTLNRCAQGLVARRRERARDPHWETFAGVRYRCTEPNCKFADTLFSERGHLMTHLQQTHRIKPPDLKTHKDMQRKLDSGRVLYPY